MQSVHDSMFLAKCAEEHIKSFRSNMHLEDMWQVMFNILRDKVLPPPLRNCPFLVNAGVDFPQGADTTKHLSWLWFGYHARDQQWVGGTYRLKQDEAASEIVASIIGVLWLGSGVSLNLLSVSHQAGTRQQPIVPGVFWDTSCSVWVTNL